MKKSPQFDGQVDHLTISLRAFAESRTSNTARSLRAAKGDLKASATRKPSSWTLIFDTETFTDPGQSFRIGTYQVHNAKLLVDAGIFYSRSALTRREFSTIREFAKANALKFTTLEAFIDDVFYPIGYELRATIVGFNMPFDISRLAISCASARGAMRGGFTFRLSNDKRKPAIQILHLSQKASLIRFAAPFRRRDSRSARKRGREGIRRGFFVDCRTLAAALFAKSFTLASLSKFLQIEHPKLSTDEYGGPITSDFLEYALRDVLTTWECYEELVRRYQKLELHDTHPPQIFSEASIGKAYLNAMGVKPLRYVQADIPPALLARILGSYFGGRSEVRIRRELRQVVLCDFTSMYPTVCTLMGLWSYVIAEGMTWQDGTEEIRRFVNRVRLADLQKPRTWKKLTALVRIEPDWDVLPVRAPYGEESQATIGANHLKVDRPIWITLADCIASKLLHGKAPKIVEALVFKPAKRQSGLRPIAIAGNPNYVVDPSKDDFYKRLIELRNEVKGERDNTTGSAWHSLDTEQNALKIAANATSYGIFVEVNVKDRAERNRVTVHSSVDRSYVIETEKDEAPGRFFHPLLATLITGAARLMLAIAERLVIDRGLEWTFCDTDSMAIAKRSGMDEAEFYSQVDEVVAWFAALNPYEFGGSILKVEDVNFDLDSPKIRKPLFCWAVSAKRYALFNLDADGLPVLRKASAHGLGHLRAPYDATNPSKSIPPPVAKLDKIGVELWQHDLWWKIASAALTDNPDKVDFNYHPSLNLPAVSRYAATTPKLLRWFDGFNHGLPKYRQVMPFGFLYSLYAQVFGVEAEEVINPDPQALTRRSRGIVKPVAPYDRNLAKAVAQCFDRETGLPVSAEALKSFKQVISPYHVHPEAKFINGDYLDRGVTQRRYVYATAFRNIGKEANEWEPQFYLGFDEEEQIDYGLAPSISKVLFGHVRNQIGAAGQRRLARGSGVSRRTIERFVRGEKIRPRTLMRIRRALTELVETSGFWPSSASKRLRRA